MTTTVTPTGITFNDTTGQATAAAAGSFNAVVYTSPGSYDAPTKITNGLRSIKLTIYGGGGGGGGSTPTAQSQGSPGGMGGVSWAIIPAPQLAVPGAAIPVTIGTGGPGGAANAVGTPGPASSFGGFVSAAGGAGGPTNGTTTPQLSIGGGTYSLTSYAGPAPASPAPYGVQTANGYFFQWGEISTNYGVPRYYYLPYGTGTPSAISPAPAPSSGSLGIGYGAGGPGGRTGPAAPGASGGQGTSGICFIEEYY